MKKKIAFMLKHSTKKNIANSRLALPLQSTVLSFPYIISFKLQETPPPTETPFYKWRKWGFERLLLFDSGPITTTNRILNFSTY